MLKQEHQELLIKYIKDLQLGGKISKLVYQKGKKLYEMGYCHLLASSTEQQEYLIIDDYQDFSVTISFQDNKINSHCNCHASGVCSHSYAATLQSLQDLSRSLQVNQEGAIKYSREGMMKRVIEERQQRAKEEEYLIHFSDNIYGEHHLQSESGKSYQISFYNFESKLGYCSCPDYQTNKLETCKHLMYAFDAFEQKHHGIDLSLQHYPFLEIYRHPLHDYQISWFYPHKPSSEIAIIIEEYFDKNQLFKEEKKNSLYLFIEKIRKFKSVKIRPEVQTYISCYFEEKSLTEMFRESRFNPNLMQKKLFPFQIEGIQFLAPKKGSILADEIGLGKSAQALGTALFKSEIIGFKSIKILCPTHLMQHWENEINLWVPPSKQSLFKLESFENLNTKESVDFIIIDEAQKIADYDSSLLQQLHKISFKHILLITDSKIENSLIKFYAVSGLIDKYLLTPLWELSYKHCLFNSTNPDEIIGYYNLGNLPKRLKFVYIRREKDEISSQFPSSDIVIIPIALDKNLKNIQSNLSHKTLELLRKKKANQYDIIQLKQYLQDLLKLSLYSLSTNQKPSLSPKLIEFQHFIRHKLNLKQNEKVLIFADDLQIQIHIKRLIEGERKAAQIIQEGQTNFDENIQYFIGREILQEDIPKVQHIVYFHIPQNPDLIYKRNKILETSMQQNRLYLLKTKRSLEGIICEWYQKKSAFLNQFFDFLNRNSTEQPLSMRLQEELIHQLTAFAQMNPVSTNPKQKIQMDLFGETIVAEKAKPIEQAIETGELNSFFEQIFKSFTAFENLNKKWKKEIAQGHFEISEENQELVIRIKKKSV